MQMVDSFIKKNELHSRNEFFEKAAENLIADEAIKSGCDVMSEKLAKAIEAAAENRQRKTTRRRSLRDCFDTRFSSK